MPRNVVVDCMWYKSDVKLCSIASETHTYEVILWIWAIISIVWVTHYVITVLDCSLACITHLPEMILGSLGFVC